MKVKFFRVDTWHRPVFKNSKGEFFGSIDKLFKYGALENEVLEQVSSSDLCYFGTRFDREPVGTSAENIEIVRTPIPKKILMQNLRNKQNKAAKILGFHNWGSFTGRLSESIESNPIEHPVNQKLFEIAEELRNERD